jgi:hypothetical protein
MRELIAAGNVSTTCELRSNVYMISDSPLRLGS